MQLSLKKLSTSKFLRDFIINAIGSALPIVLLQFLLEPLMSRHMQDDVFGLMITVVSLFTMLATIFGSSLNNVLLLKNEKIDNGLRDYNILLIIFEALNTITLVLVLFFVYNVRDPLTLILIVVVGLLTTFFSYCSAHFRIVFKYYLFLLCEVFKCIGYVAGYFLFRATDQWIYVFLLGSVLETIGCLIFTIVWRYPYKTSPHFKEISIATLFILGSSLTVSLVNYFDKLLLYPIMGGDSVSIFNSATIIAKGLSLITAPFGAVLLGYLVKKKFVTKKNLLTIILIFTIALPPLFFGFYFFSKLILPYMYPNFYEEAQKLLVYTTLFAIINIYISLCEPILLTHNGEKISLYYGIAKAVISISLGYAGVMINGLYSFCVFRFISTLIVLIMLLALLFYRSHKINNSKTKEAPQEETSDNEIIDGVINNTITE